NGNIYEYVDASEGIIQPFGIQLISNGDLYVTEPNRYRIRKITPDRNSSIVGIGIKGYSGDGGPATQSKMSNVNDIAISDDDDDNLELFITDTNNGVIRKVYIRSCF